MIKRARARGASVATVLVASIALVGAGSSGAVGAPTGTPLLTPVVLEGGCWAYTPRPLTDPVEPSGPPAEGAPLDLADPPYADLSTALEPWTQPDPDADPEEPALGPVLTTGGDTAVGGTRTFALDLPSGPVLSDLPTVGTATFHLGVAPAADPADPAAPGSPGAAAPTSVVVQQAFTVEGGEPLGPIRVEGELPVSAPGPQVLTLRGVFFDMPLLARRVACNGQPEGVPAGANPATAPLDTNLTTAFTALAVPAVRVSGIEGQRVRDAARGGDTVRVAATGLASGVPASLALCDAAAACGSPTTFTTEPDGSGSAGVRVPRDAVAGEWALRVSDGVRAVDLPLTVLGAPTLSLTQDAAPDEVEVSVEGTGWNPSAPVVVRGYAATRALDARTTSDRPVRLRADETGAFSATFTVTDRDTKRVGAVQERRGKSALRSAAVFGGFAAAPPPSDPPTGTPPADPPATVPPAPVPSAAPAPVEPDEAPLDIPLPGDGDGVRTIKPPAEQPEETEVAPTLAIGQVSLEGSASLGEWFGAAPERTLTFQVQNLGDVPVVDPEVRLVVSKSEDVDPTPVDAGIGTLEPGDTATVEIAIALPTAAFGTYHVRGGVGDAELTAFDLEWSNYPWGLFALNALGLLLLGWGVRRRLAARGIALSALLPAAALSLPVVARRTPAADGPTGDAVVDLAALQKWWELRDGGQRPPTPRPRVLGGTPAPVMAAVAAGSRRDAEAAAVEEQHDSVVDLAAADAWWEHRSTGAPLPRRRLLAVAGESAPRAVGPVAVLDPEAEAADAAIVDLAAADAWWARQERRRKG